MSNFKKPGGSQGVVSVIVFMRLSERKPRLESGAVPMTAKNSSVKLIAGC